MNVLFLLILAFSLVFPLQVQAKEGSVVSENFSCPLNGKLYPSVLKETLSVRRPLAVMIDNHLEARPQAGLSVADVVFEAVSEGGSTFLMPLFYCEAADKDVLIAPIRSARSYFVDWANGFHSPLYVHVGGVSAEGPANALGKIQELGWVSAGNDFNQFSIGFPIFERNYERIPGKTLPTEFTMQTSTQKLWDFAKEKNLTTASGSAESWFTTYNGWKYHDTNSLTRSTVSAFEYEFWPDFKESSVRWAYDQEQHAYIRSINGVLDKDAQNNELIFASNVILLFTDEEGPIDEQRHMLYRTVGEGEARIYNDRGVQKVIWRKPSSESELLFIDSKGNELKLARGLTWISVLPSQTVVKETVNKLSLNEMIIAILQMFGLK